MDMLPFYLGGFGILVLSIIGFAYLQNERLKKKLILQAQELLQQNTGITEVQQQLISQGLQEPQAVKIMELARNRILIQNAMELLQQGKTPEEVKEHLLSQSINPEQADELLESAEFNKYCQEHPVVSMLLGIVLPLVGLAVLVGGVLLWIGNKSGRFVTFPFAGQIVIVIGFVIGGLGLRFLVRSMAN